jgi:putative spermidine/putrescine transport system ATP-binding protein
MSSVSVCNVTKLFGPVRALENVSLEIGEGEFIALLGPSGCGKTTLLRSVAGLEQPTSGRILFDNDDVTHTPTRARPIGMVFQSYALFPNMTLRQNIAFPLVVRKEPAARINPRVDELLELVHLTEQADRYPNQASGGQQQRAALARALAPAPQVLLLDEPLSALDALVRQRLRDEIRRIQREVHITTLYVTHDQSEAMAIADRVAVMNHGKIEQAAKPSEIYDAPATRFSAAFVGNRNALELPAREGRVCLGEAFAVTSSQVINGRVLAFFRPEDVELNENDHGQTATVENMIFQGLLTRLYLATESDGQPARFYADIPSRRAAALEPGSAIRFYINPSYVHIFPADVQSLTP